MRASGDKGNRLNIALVCRDPAHYAAVAAQITPRVVAQAFAPRKPSTGGALRPAQAWPPSISCSTTCLKAASMPASASTATASRCRSCCWIYRRYRHDTKRETAAV